MATIAGAVVTANVPVQRRLSATASRTTVAGPQPTEVRQ